MQTGKTGLVAAESTLAWRTSRSGRYTTTLRRTAFKPSAVNGGNRRSSSRTSTATSCSSGTGPRSSRRTRSGDNYKSTQSHRSGKGTMTNDGQSSAPEEIDKASLELHKLRVDTTKAELDVRNADLILRKLQSEEMKAAADARWALRQPRFEMIKTAATLLTVAAALLSLTLSQMQSHAQTERLERNRREEAVGNLLRDAVGGESEQFRRAALAELAMYAAEPNLRPRIQRQLLSVVRYEKQPAVRSAITEVLLAQPDSNLLTLLATGSRAIRREITARLAQRDPG